ncbi:alpha-xenorhabdolysin family binary toxin subunit B [Providencia sp. wls1943]|uniref:alpha-xenorhabdolysin family binary toxin subunit B n=1 Tax=Providencia sp. wls1943 TaxID=2675150 RepID=UPI0012B581F0|nr:alpha-xenorhabdolysin family binary toxin subunit B [Providencia sp. wls1943]MTB67390.1 alpha-xenorhabdolysin family binary toxin subunit B [Providencia sp. wls1943]
MHDNLDLPMLPSIDIYQLRCISNSISSFNKNILNYDYIIYGRIQKIAIKIERLNELIRNSVPILKIKLNYIIRNDDYTLLSYENSDDLSDMRRKIAITGFVDDLMDVKFELEKLISKTRYTLESLLVFHLNEPNKLKLSQYTKQKEFLVNSKNSKQSKVNELNNNLSVILAAEDIILKHKITDFFDRYFQGKELIDSIEIQPNKKDILKAAISYIRNLLTMVDDGLEFSQLVDVRIYISDQIIEAREEINTMDNNIFRLSQLMSYANDINQIEVHKQTIITQASALKSYWESWCGFMSEKVSEECLNFSQIKTVSQMLMTYLNDIEYQYQRQLPD